MPDDPSSLPAPAPSLADHLMTLMLSVAAAAGTGNKASQNANGVLADLLMDQVRELSARLPAIEAQQANLCREHEAARERLRELEKLLAEGQNS